MMICTESLKRRCYPVLADIIVDYKEQVPISRIKTFAMLSLSYDFVKIRELEIIIATIDIQIHIVTP